jgi:hypothetical protein
MVAKTTTKAPFLAGDAGDDGCGAGAGAAAEAGAEEDDAAALERGADLFLRLEHAWNARVRDRRRPEALGEVDAELDFLLGEAGTEGADVGVECEQFGALHAIERDALQHVGAGTAEADDFDGGCGNDLGDRGSRGSW